MVALVAGGVTGAFSGLGGAPWPVEGRELEINFAHEKERPRELEKRSGAVAHSPPARETKRSKTPESIGEPLRRLSPSSTVSGAVASAPAQGRPSVAAPLGTSWRPLSEGPRPPTRLRASAATAVRARARADLELVTHLLLVHLKEILEDLGQGLNPVEEELDRVVEVLEQQEQLQLVLI